MDVDGSQKSKAENSGFELGTGGSINEHFESYIHDPILARFKQWGREYMATAESNLIANAKHTNVLIWVQKLQRLFHK